MLRGWPWESESVLFAEPPIATNAKIRGRSRDILRHYFGGCDCESLGDCDDDHALVTFVRGWCLSRAGREGRDDDASGLRWSGCLMRRVTSGSLGSGRRGDVAQFGRLCQSGTILEVGDGGRHGVLLQSLVLHLLGGGGLESLDNVKVGAGGVVLVLAVGKTRVYASSRWPLPNPVDGVRAGRDVLGDLKVRLAPELGLVVADLVGELDLTLDGNGRGRGDLVASAIVKVLSREKLASSITTRAVLGPLKNIGDLLVILGLGGAEDKDSAAFCGLTDLVLGEANVSVLEIFHGDAIARGGTQSRVVGVGIIRGPLGGMAEEIVAGNASASGRKKIVHRSAGERRVSSVDVATRVSVVANVGSAIADELKLFVPRVSCSLKGQQQECA